MKLIHCADLHLDSKLSANLEKEKVKERRQEILNTFVRMVNYAVQHQVDAILIAGDMFDTKNISANVRNTVLHHIVGNPDITFYYLKGNHDYDSFLSSLETVPSNLKLFSEEWTHYDLGKIVISGIELSEESGAGAHISLVLDINKFNIVMMHGQENELINLRELKNKGIDYLALGHIHAYKKEALDGRGSYCYPGCLEGRGFDECGEHGFVVLDVNEETGTYTHSFIPFAGRMLHEVKVDVSECDTTAEMIAVAEETLKGARCKEQDLVKIVLVGDVDVECEKDIQGMVTHFKDWYYFVKVYDETGLKVDMESFLLDESLKGEFVRMVMNASALGEEEKRTIIRYGLQAIAGEEVQ